jgi:serine/threonine-protein kinase
VRVVAQVAADLPDSPFLVAKIHAWRGETDLAFEWLDKAFAARDGALTELLYDPFLAKVRGDARYAALVRRMGLPFPQN